MLKPDVNELLYLTMSIVALFLRIIFTVWVVNIAKRQNRKATKWGLAGFMFPSITLIIIGLSKKLNKELQNEQISNTGNYNQQGYVDDVNKETLTDADNSVSENDLMRKYNITLQDEKYMFLTYKYDKLIDAVNYAKLMGKNS